MDKEKIPFINPFCTLHAKNYGFLSKNKETLPQLPDSAVYDWPLDTELFRSSHMNKLNLVLSFKIMEHQI